MFLIKDHHDLFHTLNILPMTWKVANIDPLNHLLLCLRSPTKLRGGSVKHFAPGMYLIIQFSFFFAMISRHIIRSSAKYLLAVAQDIICSTSANSSLHPFKNVLRGSPFIQFHLKVEKAPGSTETNPNKLSVDLSK
jgi:hypothetical protein